MCGVSIAPGGALVPSSEHLAIRFFGPGPAHGRVDPAFTFVAFVTDS